MTYPDLDGNTADGWYETRTCDTARQLLMQTAQDPTIILSKTIQHTYTYDALSRVLTVTDLLGGTAITEYDENGNDIMINNPNGGFITYAFDLLDRLTDRIQMQWRRDGNNL